MSSPTQPAGGVDGRGDGRPASHEDLARLAAALRSRFFAILGRYRIPPQDAEDLIQETFVLFLHKAETIRRAEPWLLSTLRNRCIMYWRQRRFVFEVLVEPGVLQECSPLEDPVQERWEAAADLATALAALPAKRRGLLVRSYVYEEPRGEVARRYGYHPSSIRKALGRSRTALATQIRAMTG